METTVANSWKSGYVLKNIEYWKCNHCGTLQQYAPFNMNYCGHCGEPKYYVYSYHSRIKKEVVE